ncbi:MAG: chromate transporter [Peptococcaceae bacterium]|nr:chromate transporter [Peptococcaceae bacterium]MBP3341112.1 chromate transporter [Peptococcaceae bacterium]MBQ3120530.1 chromate transporter [Peptococcaceae bacterium]
MKSLFQLFWIFFRIGAFTFGGGYVMIPIIQHEISEKYKLIDEDELSELLVLAQSLPGMMAVNAATSIGYRLHGKRGAVVCALGVALPSFLIIVFLAGLILHYYDNAHLQGAFRWVRAIVVGMIAAAAVKMGKPCLRSKLQIGLVLLALVLAIFKVHPVLLILGGALAGWLLTQPDREEDAS